MWCGVVWCGVVLCCLVVLCCVVLVVVWCGVVWRWCVCVSSLSFLSILFFLFLALSVSFLSFFPSSSLLVSSLFSFLVSLSSLSLSFTPTNTVQSTDQQNMASNCEAFECDVARASHHWHLSSQRELFITGIIPAMNLFFLRFFINSEKSPPGKITVITVLY